jgi:hypothetical protein
MKGLLMILLEQAISFEKACDLLLPDLSIFMLHYIRI